MARRKQISGYIPRLPGEKLGKDAPEQVSTSEIKLTPELQEKVDKIIEKTRRQGRSSGSSDYTPPSTTPSDTSKQLAEAEAKKKAEDEAKRKAELDKQRKIQEARDKAEKRRQELIRQRQQIEEYKTLQQQIKGREEALKRRRGDADVLISAKDLGMTERQVAEKQVLTEYFGGKMVDTSQASSDFKDAFVIDESFQPVPSEPTLFEKFKYAEETPTKTLIQRGETPLLIYKGAQIGGETFFRGTTKLSSPFFGIPTEEDIQKGGFYLGTFGLGAFFGPVFQTGASGKQIQKQLSKTRFDKLGKWLDDLADEIKSKPTTTEQAKVLKDVKDYYKISDENMNKLIELLKKENILTETVTIKEEGGKLIFETIGKPKPFEIDIMRTIPKLKGTGELTSLFGLSTQKTKPKVTTIQTDLTKQRFNVLTGEILGSRQQQKQQQRQKQVPLLAEAQVQVPKQIPKQTQPQKSFQALMLGTSQVQKPRLSQIQRGFGISPITRPQPKIKTPPPIIPLKFDEKPRFLKAIPKVPGYNVYVKSRNKFIKGNKIPIPKQQALSLGSWVTDNTLARTFKIKKTNKPAQLPKIKFPANYWGYSSQKFRPYRRKKGVKKPLVNTFIEKRSFGLDTPGEVNKIQVARFLAQQRKQNINLNLFKPMKFQKPKRISYKQPKMSKQSRQIIRGLNRMFGI